ncbi:hypothetical protein [Empedobacter sp. GD03739]|uniref:hypothetical protein n=1 Tax=Empedobacter sp. GD03739 TaxID=2975376 RepID=UPI002448BC92|nr:hypothetical protein [Empedobacter sp. GD03739]MDH1602348.1 hypothetical protein [Empedobacter sp. GD03739]
MPSQRLNKQKAIELILVELEKGSTYSACLGVIGRKWTLSESSFKRYWKEANSTYSERQELIQKELESKRLEAETERLKKAILTKDERLEIASNIALGKARKIGEQILIPSDGDRLRALDYLAKVNGDFAPKKEEITIKTEQPLFGDD